jgi:uncharacterized membrane protein
VEENIMSELAVIGFKNEFDAEKARFALAEKQAAGDLNIEDAVVISKGTDNTIKLNQDFVLTESDTLLGSWLGMLTGILVGAPAGPLGSLIGMSAGGAGGALLGAADDLDLEEDFKEKVSTILPPGKSALAVLVDEAQVKPAREFLKKYGGEIIATTLPADSEKKFKKAVEKQAGMHWWH